MFIKKKTCQCFAKTIASYAAEIVPFYITDYAKRSSDKVKNTFMDLEQVSNTIQITLAELNELRENQEASIQFVQCSFEEQLHKIQESREKIIAALNILEIKTLTEMKDTLTKLQASLKSDVDKCATFEDELKQFRDAIEEIRDKDKHELSHIANIKCKNKIQLIEQYRRENFVQVKSSITFLPNSEIEKFLSNLSGLGKIEHIAQPLAVRGNPDQIIRMEGHSEYVISMEGDSDKEWFCSIRDICVLPSGQVLLADEDYNNVKLLNEHYQMVTRYRLSGPPWGLCQITSSKVGVSVGSEVQFIKVKNNRLEAGRKIRLKHQCRGIAHHQGDLFVTSGSALYKYSLSGYLVQKLHEVKSDTFTIGCCAVSPTGDKLYIISYSDHSLLTLAMDGSVLASFMDPELQYPGALDVTPAGQVLVCGSESILQVDSKGSRKLETLTKPPYSVRCNPNVTPCPYSVCYNSNTGSIIAGMYRIDKILVYKVI
ncbi:uncharacterized protein LOC127845245 isoform X2 [Dreissena polymorpha]|uniref:Uncharacterized protein n=1 Tax=Dreissena polymorpha TaxID=45954 RepID=A0A9D4IGI6_DREPO|nr:uncharacterized protein LOC127845245 isoform X2 [Dreissena polymorpha]KAH3771637.1 hypothetical protein DPMN_172963 [Dreissena polymorpha]